MYEDRKFANTGQLHQTMSINQFEIEQKKMAAAAQMQSQAFGIGQIRCAEIEESMNQLDVQLTNAEVNLSQLHDRLHRVLTPRSCGNADADGNMPSPVKSPMAFELDARKDRLASMNERLLSILNALALP